jgi:DNA-binding transcriptional LysR family regulator
MGMPGLDSLKRAVEMGLGSGVIPGSVAFIPGPRESLAAVPLAAASSGCSLTLIYGRTDSLCQNTSLFIDIVRNSRATANL